MTADVHCLDEAAMVAFGARLGRAAALGGIIYLQGVLGAGKTTLCRGILRSYGHQGAVKSPTYTLVEPYEFAGLTVYHFDLYRLGDPEELEYVGIRDYFADGNLCLIEWPKRGEGFLPEPDLIVKVAVPERTQLEQPPGRCLQLQTNSHRGEKILTALSVNSDVISRTV